MMKSVEEKVREWITDHFGEELRHTSHTKDLVSLLKEQYGQDQERVTAGHSITIGCRYRTK